MIGVKHKQCFEHKIADDEYSTSVKSHDPKNTVHGASKQPLLVKEAVLFVKC